jgi:hypothetical protein
MMDLTIVLRFKPSAHYNISAKNMPSEKSLRSCAFQIALILIEQLAISLSQIRGAAGVHRSSVLIAYIFVMRKCDLQTGNNI